MTDIINVKHNDKEVAYVTYGIESDPIFDREGDEIGEDTYYLIDNVYVAPECRGMGYAKAMIKDAIEKMKAERPDLPIRIVACPKDEDICPVRLADFYDSLGFFPVETCGDNLVMEMD